MVGERYGKLVVIEEYITTLDNGTRRRRVSKCKCDCGNFITDFSDESPRFQSWDEVRA